MKTYKLSDLFKTRWEDLIADELIQVIDLSDKLFQLRNHTDTIEYGHAVIAIMRVLRRNKKLVAKIENEEAAVDCFNAITFFKRNSKGEFITPWLHFPVNGYNFGLKSFAPPATVSGLPMYNLIFDQLVYADSAFSKFCVLNHEYQLTKAKMLEKEIDICINGLISILYTKPEHFTPIDLDVNANLVPLHLNARSRALVLHSYANVRSFIINRCPNLFPPPPEDNDEAEAPAPVFTGSMWMNLRFDLAETEVFKGLETSRNALIYDALDYLDKKAFEVKTQKQHAQV